MNYPLWYTEYLAEPLTIGVAPVALSGFYLWEEYEALQAYWNQTVRNSLQVRL